MTTQKSLFVTFDGPNGVGKTTIIRHVTQKLVALGHNVLCTREPTNSPLGDFLRNAEELYERETLACIAAADRYFHIEKDIKPALQAGRIVLSDRYVESSLALQCLDGCSLEFVWNLNSQVLVPNLSVVLVADPAILDKRLANDRTKFSRFEQEVTRKQELQLYREAAELIGEKGFSLLLLENDKQSPDDVSDRIVTEIQNLLNRKEETP